MKTAGVDPRRLKFVVFNSGPQSITAALGGHVDVAVTPVSGAVAHMQGGRMRIIAVTADRALTGAMTAVPTWREQGVDTVFSSWRGVIGPKSMTREQIAYWEDVLVRIVSTDEWKREMEKNYWEGNFMKSAETTRFLRGQYEQYRVLFTELGLSRR